MRRASACCLAVLLAVLCAPAVRARSAAAKRKQEPQAGTAQQAPLRREPPEMITDRPDQTESTSIVAPRAVQVETGWTFERVEFAGLRADAHTLPGTLVRIGALERAEVRVAWSGYVRQSVREGGARATTDGAGDAELSVKVLLRETGEQAGPLPEAAFLAGTSLPTGSAGLGSGRTDPSFRLLLASDLAERVSVGANAGMYWETSADAAGRETTLSRYLYTLALGIGVTDRLGTFVEIFGDLAGSAAGAPAHSLDAGFTYLLRRNVQLDFSAGAGLSAAAPDWFLGAGISFRLPE